MMLRSAHESAATLAPFRNVYDTQDGSLLANRVFYVPNRHIRTQVLEDQAAINPQVINLPDRTRFEIAVNQWMKDIRFDSFPADMKDHVSFNEIVEQGYGVVPLIAAHLRRKPSFLFLALEEIFDEDPVPEDAYGKLSTVTAAWLEWLKR
jgi:hypothetical protein